MKKQRRKGTPKRPHLRRSKRGKSFRAGKGKTKKKRYRRASKLRRDEIRMLLKTKGYHRKDIVKIMEKDPLLWKEYRQTGRPKITVVKGLVEKKDAFALVDLDKNRIKIDERFFKKPLIEKFKSMEKISYPKPEKILESDMPIIPKELLREEIQHLKDLKGKSLPKKFEDIAESAAFWRSQFDIRKYGQPPKRIDQEIAFRGPVLRRTLK